MIFDTAKVMSKGQITLPVDIRKSMNLETGDRVALIHEGNKVIIMNPALYAMETFQREIEGEFERAGINSEKDVLELTAEIRSETIND